MSKISKIFYINLSFVLMLTSCSASEIEPEEVHAQYLKAVPLADNIKSLDSFLSANNIASRTSSIEKLKSRGKIESKIHDRFLKNRKHKVKCLKNLKQIKKIKSAKVATITYSFDDICSTEMMKKQPEIYGKMIVANIKEVSFVYENGWKIDKSSVRPEKPQVIRIKNGIKQ